MPNPSKPPFWEKRRGGGPITDRIESLRRSAELAAKTPRATGTPRVPLGSMNGDGNRRIGPAMPRRQIGE